MLSVRLLLCSLAISLLAAPVVEAHAPHDAIYALALSPEYSSDGTVFISQSPATNWRLPEAKRSTDNGVTWGELPQGMDNLTSFTSATVSPSYPAEPAVFYTTSGDGIFRSLDGGDSWERANNGLPTLDLADSFAVTAVGNGVALFVRSAEGGVYRSRDLGKSWTESLGPAFALTAVAAGSEFATVPVLFAGNGNGDIYASVNGGNDWVSRSSIPGAGRVSQLAIVPGFRASRTLFAATAGGVYRSTDGGSSWEEAIGLPDDPAVAVAVSPDWESDSTVFATTQTQAVFRSTDGGDSWTLNDVGVELSPQSAIHFYDLQISRDFATDGTLFLAAWEGLFLSEDRGVTWKERDTRPPRLMTNLALSPLFDSDGVLVATSYGGGLYVSEDAGDSWQVANVGLVSTNVYDAAVALDSLGGLILFAVQQEMLLRSDDLGQSWQQAPITGIANDIVIPTRLEVSPDYLSDGFIGVGTRRDGLIATNDEGQGWQALTPRPGSKVSSVVFSPDFASDATLFLATNGTAIARSTSGGSSWQLVHQSLPSTPGGRWLAISPDYALDQTLFVGTPAGLYGTTDGGDSWAAMGDLEEVSGGTIEAVAVSSNFGTDRRVIASVRGAGLFESQDAGASWSPLAPQLLTDGLQVSELRFSPDFATDDTLFALADTSVLRSNDGGVNWTDVSIDRVRHEETRQTLVFSEGWTSIGWNEASVGKLNVHPDADASLEVCFSGTGVEWIGARAPLLGIAEVWVDGVLVGTVDQYAPQRTALEVLYASEVLPPGPHELRLVSTSESHPDATGNGISVDAIDIDR